MNLSFASRRRQLRVKIFRQRGSIAGRPLHLGNIPTGVARLPPVLADLIMEKRGLIMIGGATGSARVDDHRVVARLPQHQPFGPS
jgi:twitching motility protein PilU